MDDMRWLLILFFFLFLSGCVPSTPKPSFLIIAVELLGSEEFFCDDKESEYSSGLGLLCQDGVRFTHAYAPSTMSQPALAAILTGLYPKDSGIWHNGNQFLSEKIQTVQEVAVENGYRTSFFSGGPPIWRKSGLDQGFELFEDNVSVSLKELYRPVQKNFQLFINWLDDIEKDQSFFSVLYLPDLQFPEKVTINDFGQERALVFESQLREINESFAYLANYMQKQKIWDNTYVFVMGLNGPDLSTREFGLKPLNLRSDKTQVLLMIKPARKPRDSGIDWSIDANVSLVDVGATLFDLLDSAEYIKGFDSQLEVISIKNSLNKPVVNWEKDRFLLFESAWATWRNVGLTRMAMRQGPMLYIHDREAILYNSLSDRIENQPIGFQNPAFRNQFLDFTQYFAARGISKWEGLPNSLTEKIRVFEQIQQGELTEALKLNLSHLAKIRPWDKQIIGWLAQFAIATKDWALLKKLGEESHNSVWTYVAIRNLGGNANPPSDSCWSLLNSSRAAHLHSCNDKEFVAFADWVRTSDTNRKSALEEKFFRIHYLIELDDEIVRLNYHNHLVWDTVVDNRSEPRLLELALTISDYRGFRQVIEQRMKH